MGNSQSTVTNIVNRSSMSVVNDFVSTTIATTQASSTNIQTFTLNIGAASGCPMNIGQKIEAQVSAIATVDDIQAQQLQTNLSSALTAAALTNTEMVNGVMAATAGNSQSTRTNITNTIDQAVRNTVNATTINQVAATSFNLQTMTLNIGVCQNSPIQANQGIISNVIAQNILTKVSNAIVSSNLVASATANAASITGMQNKGIDDIIKAITGPMGMSVIACVILLCLVCAGVLAFMLSPAGQEATTTSASAGANVAKSRYS